MRNILEYVPTEKIIKIFFDNSQEFTIIDEPTLYKVENFYWHKSGGYATCWTDGTYKRMHNILLSTNGVDHKDRDKLNNRINNLRPATDSQNRINSPAHKDNKSGYKGVSFCRHTGKWQVKISYLYNRKFIGRFTSKEEAALAYNKAAIKYFGEFAYLNVIP